MLSILGCLGLSISVNSIQMKETFPQIWKKLEVVNLQIVDELIETSSIPFTLESKEAIHYYDFVKEDDFIW